MKILRPSAPSWECFHVSHAQSDRCWPSKVFFTILFKRKWVSESFSVHPHKKKEGEKNILPPEKKTRVALWYFSLMMMIPIRPFPVVSWSLFLWKYQSMKFDLTGREKKHMSLRLVIAFRVACMGIDGDVRIISEIFTKKKPHKKCKINNVGTESAVFYWRHPFWRRR